MDRWWKAREVPGAKAYLRRLIHKDFGFSDFDLEVVETVIRMAARGVIEVGERDGGLVVRLPPGPNMLAHQP